MAAARSNGSAPPPATITNHHHQIVKPMQRTLFQFNDSAGVVDFVDEATLLFRHAHCFWTVGCLPPPWIAPEASPMAQPHVNCLECGFVSSEVFFKCGCFLKCVCVSQVCVVSQVRFFQCCFVSSVVFLKWCFSSVGVLKCGVFSSVVLILKCLGFL